jgi:hypothetical protein
MEVIQEHEGLDELAEVGWAHEPRDGAAAIAPRAVDDLARGVRDLLNLICKHDFVFHWNERYDRLAGRTR